jgi:hypothetical protein
MRLTIPDELLAQVPADLRNKSCICRQCVVAYNDREAGRESILVTDALIDQKTSSDLPLSAKRGEGTCLQTIHDIQLNPATGREACATIAQPGEFYFDTNGLMVFTAAYHLRRGYCCGSGCRHCPYPAAK